jgi:iron complex outermembrane receptor protein
MKTIYKKLLFLVLFLPFSVLAQSTLEGVVLDAKTKSPLPGVNVTIQGTTSGTSTDFDGKFKLAKVKKGDKIVFSFIGYKNIIINYDNQKEISIKLEEESNQLQEVVVQVGYGSVKKKDATGSVSVISSKDFNTGAIVSADQLLIGKTPGVRITSDGGQPDSAPNIRIRGGASLNAENTPLIVIDNVPIDNQNAAGNSNPLSLINPNDIESFTILKDASATAIYGARASNGVIIITTKRGTSGKPQFNFSTTSSFGTVSRYINVMDGSTFANYITQNYAALAPKLGASTDLTNPLASRYINNTNWQDVIYRTSYSQDYNFSARASILNKIPLRASLGYNNTEGVVKYNDYYRYTASIKISPSFFTNHLKIDVNAKGIESKKNAIDAGGVIGSALSMDPTKPVYGNSPDNRFIGYYQETVLNSGQYQNQGPTNPLASLEQKYSPQKIQKLVGNIEIDYKFHFLPELRAVANLGMEASESNLSTIYSDNSIETYAFDKLNSNPSTNYVFNPGISYKERQTIMNKTFDFYLNYSKKFNGFVSRFETQAGHTYQKFLNDGYKNTFSNDITTGLRYETFEPTNRYYQTLVMESYFERTNIDFLNRYLLTFTVRADASSLFPKDTRWGYFPASGLAWKMKEENFMKNSKMINDMKLRLGYGLTGNSDIRGIAGYFPYIALFSVGNSTSQYLSGVNSYNAIAFNPNLKWETTTTSNAGLDFELFKKGIVSGSVDVYNRKTKDLLAKVPIAPGQLLTNEFISNVGSMTNRGVEANLVIKLVANTNLNWSINGNIAYNRGVVDDLNGNERVLAGESSIPNGTGTKIAYHKVGEQPYSAWIFEQVYDVVGKPIQNVFVDRNNDGKIDDNDRYYVALRPNWTFGFGTTFNYLNFDLMASFRGQIGGKVYNARILQAGWADAVKSQNGNSANNILNMDIPFQNVNGNVPFSDYFLENATFLRCESLSIGYKLNHFYKNASSRIFLGVNNLFILTKYSGQDPENFNAIDNNFYPRPRIFNMGVNIDF